MKKNKKIIAILPIIIVISLISGVLTRYVVKQSITRNVAQYETAQASTTEDGRFEYTELSDGTIEISKYTGTDTVVEIPSTIAGKSVTSIGYGAFEGCISLTNITIPEGVTSIEGYAFCGCISLTNITIPEGVTSIGSSAFEGCGSLTNITIPEQITSIESQAFGWCSSLTDITIPEGVTSIESSAFRACIGLTNIKVDSNNKNYCDIDGVLYRKDITEIIKYPARKNGTEYNIPEGVTSIGAYAFDKCSSLTNITIPEGVTSIGEYAFSYCSDLTNIKIPEDITSIEDYTFEGCISLTNIKIPEGVTSIGAYAFDKCSSLTNITIPEGVTSIGECAFRWCSDKLIIYCKSNTTAEKYAKENNILYVTNEEKPTCTITANKTNPTNAKSIIYTFTFSEEVTGFTKEDVMVTNGIKGTFSGSKNIYTLVVTNSGNCTQTVSIASGVCTDTVGNGNNSASKEITIDITNPTAGTMTMKLRSSTGEDYTNNTWTNKNVYISVNNGSDAESGHKSTTYKINSGEETAEPQTLTKSGTYEIVVTTTDNAGNIATNMYIVKIRRAKSIEITTNPTRLIYLAGDEFDSTGMEISVIYDNQDKEKATEYTVVNWPYPLKCGNNKIEIQYNNNPEIKTELEVEAQHIEEILEEKEPTCMEDGCTEGKHCSECKTILVKQEVIPALGHSFTNYKSNNDATCTQDGTKTAKCDRCNETHTKVDVGSKLSHNYENGICTECGTKESKITITTNTYKIEETYISKIEPKTTVKTLKENLQTNTTEIKIYNKNGEEQEENCTVATGMTITFKLSNETKTLKLIVAGDVNGDGKADFQDMVSMNKHRLNKKALEREYLIAGDVTEDNKVDFKDMIKINKFRLNKILQIFETITK